MFQSEVPERLESAREEDQKVEKKPGRKREGRRPRPRAAYTKGDRTEPE